MLIIEVATMTQQGDYCADAIDGLFAVSLLIYDGFLRSFRHMWLGVWAFASGHKVQTQAACLCQREREVLLWAVQGHSTRAIAMRLGITEAILRIQLKRVLDKIRVDNRTQAAVWALANLSEFATPVGTKTETPSLR